MGPGARLGIAPRPLGRHLSRLQELARSRQVLYVFADQTPTSRGYGKGCRLALRAGLERRVKPPLDACTGTLTDRPN